MNKAYKRINWENYPSDATPLNEANLNKLDSATDTLDDRVITLETTKATKTEVATLVADVTFEESTGIITITKKNGSKVTIDTQMEKIAVNFDYDPTTQQIILTLIDGTKQYIDLSALITQYEFLDTDTVAFIIGTDGKVSAIVKEGSIEEKHLEPNYLAKIKVESAKAQASQESASTSATNAASSAATAESYAIGGTGTRDGEDADNAKYYSEQARAVYEELQGEQVTGVKGAAETEYRKGNVNLTPEDIGALPENGTAASATKAEQDGNGKVIADTYLPKASVVNNNTTTASGFTLDARQANPNVAGSLGENVSSLADSVSNIGTFYTVSNSSITVGTSNTLLTSKSLPAGTYVVVGEFYIPSGYSGELNCVLTTASASGSAFGTTRIHKSSTSGSVRIQTTGVIKLGTTTNVCVAGKTATSVSGCEGVLRAIRIK